MEGTLELTAATSRKLFGRLLYRPMRIDDTVADLTLDKVVP